MGFERTNDLGQGTFRFLAEVKEGHLDFLRIT